jgi:predicted nuclease of restriction endonuclease-like RecB superfamily
MKIPLTLKTPGQVVRFWDALPKKEQTKANARRLARVVGMRSMGEVRFAADLNRRRIGYEYEPDRFDYTPPKKNYTPDFRMKRKKKNGEYMYIEFKGHFTGAMRSKMLLVKKEHPDLDVRLIFMTPKHKLNKRSKTTYAMWAEQHGFPWAEMTMPNEWRKE